MCIVAVAEQPPAGAWVVNVQADPKDLQTGYGHEGESYNLQVQLTTLQESMADELRTRISAPSRSGQV